jgi:hypothetical protein
VCLIVDDIYPYKIIGSACGAFNHNAVPSGVFQLCRETPAEFAAREPLNRIGVGSESLYFTTSGRGRDDNSGKWACHYGDYISRIKRSKRELISRQIPENGETDSVPAAKLLILSGVVVPAVFLSDSLAGSCRHIRS